MGHECSKPGGPSNFILPGSGWGQAKAGAVAAQAGREACEVQADAEHLQERKAVDRQELVAAAFLGPGR